jgi:hypothetical protein
LPSQPGQELGLDIRFPGGKGLSRGKDSATAASPEDAVILGGLEGEMSTPPRLPGPWQEGLATAVAWHEPQKPPSSPSFTAQGWEAPQAPWFPDERRFLRVIKPSPLGTMGPYVTVSFT